MSHTKGNWEPIIKHYPKNPKEIYIGVGVVDPTVKTGVYATMICDSILPETDKDYIKEHEEIKANMILIAAAPEMLEALKSANNYFVDLQNKCALTNPDERAWKLISKAIKKATE